MPLQFFVYDPENGIEFYATAEQAKAAVEAVIEEYRDYLDGEDGWCEDIIDVCWGEVKEAAQEIDAELDPDTMDYAMKPVVEA
jgi:hypothetical protein